MLSKQLISSTYSILYNKYVLDVLCIGLYKTFSESYLILLSIDNQLFVSIFGSYYTMLVTVRLPISFHNLCTVYIVKVMT